MKRVDTFSNDGTTVEDIPRPLSERVLGIVGMILVLATAVLWTAGVPYAIEVGDITTGIFSLSVVMTCVFIMVILYKDVVSPNPFTIVFTSDEPEDTDKIPEWHTDGSPNPMNSPTG